MKKATLRIYDGEQKRLIEVPDHNIRLAVVALDLAYREGKPFERAQVLHAKAEHFPEKLARLNQSEVYRDKFFQEKIAELHKSGKPHRSGHRTKYYKLGGSRVPGRARRGIAVGYLLVPHRLLTLERKTATSVEQCRYSGLGLTRIECGQTCNRSKVKSRKNTRGTLVGL